MPTITRGFVGGIDDRVRTAAGASGSGGDREYRRACVYCQ